MPDGKPGRHQPHRAERKPMLAIIGRTVIAAADCIRCGVTSIRSSDVPAVGFNADTLTPLRPDGTLTDPHDPDFAIGVVCQRCNTIITLLADEMSAHAHDLITYFKVVFPLGRFDRITTSNPAQPDHQPASARDTDANPPAPQPSTSNENP
jgi:hypothetical protein